MIRDTVSRKLAVLVLAYFVTIAESRAVDLLLIPAEGGEPRVLLSDPTRALGSPDWSPDGKVIALDTWKLDGDSSNLRDAELALFTLESGEFEVLGPGAMPSWSPDGTQLVCHTYNPNQIVVLNADGSGREAILDQWGSPRWAHDGLAIFTASGGGLARFDIKTGKQTIVAARNNRLWQGVSVSPDGNGFCFAATSGGIGVALKDEAGKFTTSWKWKTLNGRHSSWSPDGKRIVAAVNPGNEQAGKWGLFYLDPYGDQPPELVPGSRTLWIGTDPDWSPDGKSIVFTGAVLP